MQEADLPLTYLLALEERHWQHHQRISTSLNYLICKKLMVDAKFQLSNYQSYVDQIDKFVNRLLKVPTQQAMVGSWLNTLIFNVAALNDEYQEQLSHSLSVESHQSQDLSIEVLDNLHHLQKQCMSYLLNASCLQYIVNSTKGQSEVHTSLHKSLHQMQYALLTTIRYLCDKMGIQVAYDKELNEKLKLLNECPCQCCEKEIDQKVRKEVNELIFGKAKQNKLDMKELESKLNNNYSASLISISRLIDANYYTEQNKRIIFNDCLLSGGKVIEQITNSFLGAYNKNQLFSQSMLQTDRLFQLLLSIVQYRHLGLYAGWVFLLNNHLQKGGHNKDQQIVAPICNFLYSLLTEHQEFTNLIRHMAKQLTSKCKYSQAITMDLMKKFMLNRFLLSPNLYYLYGQNQVGEEQFGREVNKIRLLFYPKKSPLKQSEQIEAILSRVLYGAGERSVREKSQNKTVVYHLDQSLKSDYENIYSDLFEQYPTNNDKNSSSEISFSFVKNNTPRQEPNTSRKWQQAKTIQITPKTGININIPQENDSINTILSKLNNINQVSSPKSEKSSKTVLTQLTDVPANVDREMSMVDELVNRRRMLGVARRAIDQKIAKRAEERQKMRYYFKEVHNCFDKLRRQIEKDVNQVRLDLEML